VNVFVLVEEEKGICAGDLVMRDQRILWIVSIKVIGRAWTQKKY
jgi:hypothetical protein